MNDFLDAYTVVFIALAIFVIFRLRAVLGQRTGTERPPFNPFERAEAPPAAQDDGKVVPLPTARPQPVEAPAPVNPQDLLKGIAEPGTDVAQGMIDIMRAEPDFEPKGFLMGARAAYEMIVLAFARGDRRALKDLLAREVYDDFVAAITDRESRGEKVETTFVSIDKSDIVEASLRGKTAAVTVRFVSKLITSTRDASGKVVDGNPERISDLSDVWTFAREAGSRDPNWKLVGTRADA